MRCTTCQRRITGRPSTSGTPIRPWRSSSPIVCSDSRLTPSAGHHRLLDRLVARHLHRDASAAKRCSAKNSSIAARVPEPGSRTMKRLARQRADRHVLQRCSERMARRVDEHHAGAWRTARRASASSLAAAGPSPPGRTSLRLHQRRPAARGCRTRRRTSTPGCSSRNSASSRGRKYFAVLTMPIVSTPALEAA